MLNSIKKREKWINSIENENIVTKTENYLVTSNYDYFYIIGKISIQIWLDISLGIKSLINFLILQNNFNLNKDQNAIRKELKSKYWIGIGLYYSGNITTAKSLLKKINPELQKFKEIEKYNRILKILKNSN